VGFANEIGTLSKSLGANGRDVMSIVCRDTRLNISPAYLRPGFAFGGSCLPKDVRALTRFAQHHAIRTDLLAAILPSNDSQLARAFQMIRETGCRRLGLVGLSFKAGTDDLRESPQVVLAETLLGRGFDLKIYDPGVRVSGLVGSNLSYVDRHLPHLAALLVDSPKELYDHAELLVLGTDIANGLAWETDFTGETIDLRRDLAVPGGSCQLAVVR
jgi:GDP-mannose 6-dehydrogenase